MEININEKIRKGKTVCCFQTTDCSASNAICPEYLGGETTCGVNARVPIDQQAEVKPAFPYCMSEREASSKEKICLC